MSPESTSRPRRRRRRWRRRLRTTSNLIGVLLVGFIVYTLATSHAAKRSATTTSRPTVTTPAVADIHLTACKYTFLAAVAKVRVTNHGDLRLNYVVTVFFISQGKGYSVGTASINYMPPHTSKELAVTGVAAATPPKNLKCFISKIERFA